VETRNLRVIALRIVATIAVYNEADIIGQVLDHLYEQGILFVVLDNGSKDDSIEIVRSYEGKGLLEHRTVRRDHFRWGLDLDCMLEMASRHDADWILRNDADEFLQPPEADETLCAAIAKENDRGVNVIQFDNFEFCLTEKDYNSNEPDIRKKLRFYTWSDDFRYKAWKYYLGTTDRESGGHYPFFPGGIKARIGPRKFVMRHYRFRSPDQALRKVFKERLPRHDPEERARGWHWHYDHFKEDPEFFILDSKRLSRYENGVWDMARRFDWYPNWRYPTREELFGT